MKPDSIRSQSFKSGVLGYNRAEVKQFLDMVAAEMELMQTTVRELTERAARLDIAVEGYRKWESNLNAFLDQLEKRAADLEEQTRQDAERIRETAEQERRRILDNAREEAELIRKEAEHKSKVFLANANSRLRRIHDQIQQLYAQRLALVTRIKSILQAEIDFVDALLRDDAPPRAETLEYSEFDVSGEGLDASQLEEIVRRLEEVEGQRK